MNLKNRVLKISECVDYLKQIKGELSSLHAATVIRDKDKYVVDTNWSVYESSLLFHLVSELSSKIDTLDFMVNK